MNGVLGLVLTPLAQISGSVVSGPFNVKATYGSDEEGRDKSGDTLPELIPATLDSLIGSGNNVSVSSVSGQPPSSIGLGFFPLNGTDVSEFDPMAIFSQISGPFCEIISRVLGVDFTAFPIPFPGVVGDSTFPGFGGSPPIPGSNGTTPAPLGTPNATIRDFGTLATLPTNNPTILSSSVPSDGPLPTNVTTSAGPLITDVSTSLPAIPTVVHS